MRRSRHLAIGLAIGWAVLVLGALIVTLGSLRTDDFDGLNNLAQVPFALPWFFVVPSMGDHVADAWITAGFGMVNAVLVYVIAGRLLARAAAR